MTRMFLLSTFFVAAAASAQVQLPVQGFLTGAGGGVVTGSQSLQLALVDELGTVLRCESQTVTVDAGFFTAVLGEAGVTACDGTTPPPLLPERLVGPLSLEVALAGGAVLGIFPLGETPRAGVAALAGGVVDELPRVVRVDDGDALLAALLAAATSPTVIELGAGTYRLADLSILPNGTDLRGQGAFTTRLLTNALRVRGNNRISGLTIESPVANDAVTLALNPAPGEVIELIDARVLARPPTGLGIPMVIDEISDVTSRVILRDVEIDARSNTFVALGIVDEQGVSLELTNTTIKVDAATEGIGIRVGLGGAFVSNFALRIQGGSIDVTGDVGRHPVVGLETFARGGTTEAHGLELRTNGTAIAANGGRVTVRDTRVTSPVLSFASAGGLVRLARSGVSQTVTVGDAPVCVLSYLQDTLTPLGSGCTAP